MLTIEEQGRYIERVARDAATGIVGFAPPAESELVDAIVNGLWEIVADAEARGLHAAMVQTSILPDGAHVVG